VAGDIRVEIISDSAFPEWNRFVASSPDGSVYSTPEYLDVLSAAAGGRFRILAAYRNDEIAGGVALYERRSAFGEYVSPRLLLYYNGLVLGRYDTKYPSERTGRQNKVLAGLEEELARMQYGRVTLRSRAGVTDVRPFLSRGWTAEPGYSYVVPLTDLGAQWKRVEQNLRRLVERCADQGVAVSPDDDFDSFYHLHALTLKRRGVASYLPRGAFAIYFKRLRDQKLCALYQARLPDGRTIASQLVLLGSHPMTHTVSAAGDPEFNRIGAAAFLRWKVFEALSTLGYSGNDLTDATLNPVTHFKSQLGADLEMHLVVQSRDTRRYRWGIGAVGQYWRLRERAGNLVRRLRRERRP
jgi:hypothetical protein